jgi:plasmid stability protein
MATLYVENVPDELYKALRERARQHRKSITAEVLSLLADNVVTAAERKARQQFLKQAQRLRAQRPSSAGGFPSSEELQREDRGR